MDKSDHEISADSKSLEKFDLDEDSGIESRATSVADIVENGNHMKTIADDVLFSTAPLMENVKQDRKRKMRSIDEAELEKKRRAEEQYEREIHEQRYKRLMHLLNRSQFYSSFLVNKIEEANEKSNVAKPRRKGTPKGKAQNTVTDENTPPTNNKKDSKKVTNEYDIREYISKDMQKKMKTKKVKFNLSQEEIEEELSAGSDTDISKETKPAFIAPIYFNGSLREYQVEGLQWLKVLYENGVNGLLGDEMGLGKTIQVIALICHLIEKQQGGPYLIVAPLSTIPNWIMEFEKFAPKVPIVVLHGTEQQRAVVRAKAKQYKAITESYKTQPVVLTTYEVPLREQKFLMSQKWRYIIIDEGHRIKNYNCQLVSILKKCKSMNRLLLTGTPLQNNLAELWSLLNFLLPEIFNDLAIFESWFNAKELHVDGGTNKLLKQEEEKNVLSTLREILKPFMLRREKSDVCLDIPPKEEVIVYAPLTVLQHDLYKAVLNRDLDMLTKLDDTVPVYQDGTRPKRKSFLNSIYGRERDSDFQKDSSPVPSLSEMDDTNDSEAQGQTKSTDSKEISQWRLYTDVNARNRDYLLCIGHSIKWQMYKKIVNHPYLIQCPLDSVGLPKIDDDLIKSSGKLLVLDAMLERLHKQGHKVLVFSTWTRILDMLEDYLSLRKYRYERLDGSVEIEKRKESIHSFNSNPDIFLFLISTRAGGVGLNLASADTVIIYDSDWNPQADIQAMARCHRIGQTKPVVIYRLCTKGTIDESIINRAELKRMLEKVVISKEARVSTSDKETLIQLKQLLESKDSRVVTSENKVFTEAELDKLLDRSHLLQTRATDSVDK